MTTDHEIVWLAGLLEGEGSFALVPGNTVQVSLGMTDLDVVERAVAAFPGAGRITTERRKNPKHKDVYRVHWYGDVARALMQTILPDMGARRSEKIRQILAAWADTRVKVCIRCETEFVVESAAERLCSPECRKEHFREYNREAQRRYRAKGA